MKQIKNKKCVSCAVRDICVCAHDYDFIYKCGKFCVLDDSQQCIYKYGFESNLPQEKICVGCSRKEK